jgi:hypothetical protein
MLSAMLIIFAGSFAFGSINDSKGSGGGDSSVAVENVDKFKITKIENKVKSY